MFTSIKNFFLFKGNNKEINIHYINLLKKFLFFFTSIGFSWGLFLVYKEQSYTLWGYTFHNNILVCLASIFNQSLFALGFTYLIHLFDIINGSLIDESHVKPTDKDKLIFNELTEKIKEYEHKITLLVKFEEKENLTRKHIEEIRLIEQNLSEKKQTLFLKNLLNKKIIKLEKKLEKHKL